MQQNVVTDLHNFKRATRTPTTVQKGGGPVHPIEWQDSAQLNYMCISKLISCILDTYTRSVRLPLQTHCLTGLDRLHDTKHYIHGIVSCADL